MCWRKERPKLNGNLDRKSMYIARVISSCTTPEQMWNTYLWGFKVIKNLEDQDMRKVKKLETAYEWTEHIHKRYETYYRMIANSIHDGLINMVNTSAKKED